MHGFQGPVISPLTSPVDVLFLILVFTHYLSLNSTIFLYPLFFLFMSSLVIYAYQTLPTPSPPFIYMSTVVEHNYACDQYFIILLHHCNTVSQLHLYLDLAVLYWKAIVTPEGLLILTVFPAVCGSWDPIVNSL